ncbi:GlxA family transcriptional regulator [Cognatiyoonia sp. IB215182]|uniref:GlxA family transcriptional regulator n=1 Tax=Cognatiyoonia sp. IB215182 TaxID=3097353 RepID=UPI002A143E5F|nr:helix-turn-helix domain-containing protein [Cognatiyoonia sp. IB215182]MDX8352846.1 helix-turn-helix domain-containing protein [Cognatiyoonia sp. IB215182]
MQTPTHFDVFVADGFVLTELAGVVDVLRLVNRISARPIFEWHFRSLTGGTINSSSGAMVSTTPLPARPNADYFVALGNSDANARDLSLGATIATYKSRQARVVLLAEAASRYIAETDDEAGLHTTHWENRAVLSERYGLFETQSALAADTGPVITGAGMGATVDLMLSLAGHHVPSTVLMTVSDVLLHERIRHHSTLQPFSGQSVLATGDAALDAAIALMQNNIEFPIPISLIADETGLSKRSLERKFNRLLGTTPNGYYRALRLNKANNLLLNTDMRIHEIGLACGFPSGFTTIYRETFGVTPNAARRKGRTP